MQECVVRQIRMLHAMRRGLETGLRRLLLGHEGGNPERPARSNGRLMGVHVQPVQQIGHGLLQILWELAASAGLVEHNEIAFELSAGFNLEFAKRGSSVGPTVGRERACRSYS
jgi:hypothetical protein